MRADIGEILVDTPEMYAEAREFVEQVMPQNLRKLKHYADDIPLFNRFQIESQIEGAYERSVRLPSGGSLVIDQTEALTAVDVNSSRATKGGDIEETAFNTNLEAAEEVARQMRLRDLGGLVVIDFIDMTSNKHQREVENRLAQALKHDRARVQLGRISKFGLMEMSRQRLRPSLGESSQLVCPRCDGHGRMRSIESLSLSIIRLAEEHAMKDNTGQVLVQAPVEISNYLLNEKRRALNEIEKRHDAPIVIVADESLHTPHFEVTRIRENELGEETAKPSYQRGTPRKLATIALTKANLNIPAAPAVTNVKPARPAPMREDREEAPRPAAAQPKPAQPQAQQAAPQTPPPAPTFAQQTPVSKPRGFMGWLKGIFGGAESAPAQTAAPAPAPRAQQAQPSQRSERNDRQGGPSRRDGQQRGEQRGQNSQARQGQGGQQGQQRPQERGQGGQERNQERQQDRALQQQRRGEQPRSEQPRSEQVRNEQPRNERQEGRDPQRGDQREASSQKSQQANGQQKQGQKPLAPQYGQNFAGHKSGQQASPAQGAPSQGTPAQSAAPQKPAQAKGGSAEPQSAQGRAQFPLPDDASATIDAAAKPASAANAPSPDRDASAPVAATDIATSAVAAVGASVAAQNLAGSVGANESTQSDDDEAGDEVADASGEAAGGDGGGRRRRGRRGGRRRRRGNGEAAVAGEDAALDQELTAPLDDAQPLDRRQPEFDFDDLPPVAATTTPSVPVSSPSPERRHDASADVATNAAPVESSAVVAAAAAAVASVSTVSEPPASTTENVRASNEIAAEAGVSQETATQASTDARGSAETAAAAEGFEERSEEQAHAPQAPSAPAAAAPQVSMPMPSRIGPIPQPTSLAASISATIAANALAQQASSLFAASAPTKAEPQPATADTVPEPASDTQQTPSPAEPAQAAALAQMSVSDTNASDANAPEAKAIDRNTAETAASEAAVFETNAGLDTTTDTDASSAPQADAIATAPAHEPMMHTEASVAAADTTTADVMPVETTTDRLAADTIATVEPTPVSSPPEPALAQSFDNGAAATPMMASEAVAMPQDLAIEAPQVADEIAGQIAAPQYGVGRQLFDAEPVFPRVPDHGHQDESAKPQG
jgi:ribonuclease E